MAALQETSDIARRRATARGDGIGMVGWTNRWFDPNESPVAAPEIGVAFADVLLSGLPSDSR
jgi:hypothetical protein